MGFLRKVAGFLGFAREEAAAAAAHAGDLAGDDGGAPAVNGPFPTAAPVGTRRGFSVQVPVAVDRPNLGPVLAPCSAGEGTVQGFRWYTRRLRIDEDGDVADEFLDEVTSADRTTGEHFANPPKFQSKFNTSPTALSMRRQIVALDGNILQSLEYQGELKWV
ncbi:hypothetical protein LUZ60_009483 [Juncus effusus]|nr:hypothetical protein LUZ60_009483 [Juncus effusus]